VAAWLCGERSEIREQFLVPPAVLISSSSAVLMLCPLLADEKEKPHHSS
jgi:hypothetical protein